MEEFKTLSETHTLKEFVQALKNACIDKGALFDGDFANLPRQLTWLNLLKLRNSANENILHMVARSTYIERHIKIIEKGVSSSGAIVFINELFDALNNNDETPLHAACKYHNVHLFEFICKYATQQHLKKNAALKNKDSGYNALDLLCVSSYNERAANFLALCNSKNAFPQESLNHYQVSRFEVSDDILVIMQRFHQLMPKEMDGLLTSVDQFGNNALMLCSLTNNEILFDECLKLFSDGHSLCAAVSAVKNGWQISVLQSLCAFGRADSVNALFSRLGEHSAKLCEDSNALDWCYKTVVVEEKRRDFSQVVDAVIKAYGNKLERNIITLQNYPSRLCQSLRSNGRLVENVLAKEHVSMQYEIFCDLLFDLRAEQNTSQKFFASIDQNRNKLFAKLLVIEWPAEIIAAIANAVVEAAKAPANLVGKCKPLLMQILSESKVPNIIFPLALFYKVSLKGLSDAEKSYIELFKTSDELFQKFCQFYHSHSAMADKILARIYESKSLLRMALVQKFSIDKFVQGSKDFFVAAIKGEIEKVEVKSVFPGIK